METQSEQVNIPSEHVAVVAMFADREVAETAVDALLADGFTEDQISLVARGAGADESGKFVPGGLMVTVRAKGRERDAERIVKEHNAREVTMNRIGVTGEVGAKT
jgi:TolB-like protein